MASAVDLSMLCGAQLYKVLDPERVWWIQVTRRDSVKQKSIWRLRKEPEIRLENRNGIREGLKPCEELEFYFIGSWETKEYC